MDWDRHPLKIVFFPYGGVFRIGYYPEYKKSLPFPAFPTYWVLPVAESCAKAITYLFPLGSKLWVEDYGFAIAADTGSMIKGHRIDLFFFDSLKELKKFGKQSVTVYLLELPPPKKNTTSKTS